MRYSSEAKALGRFVVGWAISPATALKAIRVYEPVAVEGVPMHRALERSNLRRTRGLIRGVLHGGNSGSSLRTALHTLVHLLEADLQARERWAYAAMTLGMALIMGTSVYLAVSGLDLPYPLLALAFLIYAITPSFVDIRPVGDPSLPDVMASIMESGGGRVAALRALGVYEALVVDERLEGIEIPFWASSALSVRGRSVPEVLRRIGEVLRELKRIEEAWRSKERSLKSMVSLISAALGASCILIAHVVSTGLVGRAADPLALSRDLFLLGFSVVLVSSKPVRAEVWSAVSFSLAFIVASSIIGF